MTAEHRPLYVAKPKKKEGMPQKVKDYFACITKGEEKSVCRRKHLGENHG